VLRLSTVSPESSAGRAALDAAGYRVPNSNPSHHHYVIQSLRCTVGLAPSIVLQIEALQKKCNTADYVRVGGVSYALAAEACALAGDLLKRPASRVTRGLARACRDTTRLARAPRRVRIVMSPVPAVLCQVMWFVSPDSNASDTDAGSTWI
jgi:hypothetical protein